MNAMEFAKGIEQEGKEYYLKLARETPVAGLKGIFEFLANEEQRHFEIFDAFGRGVQAPDIIRENVIEKTKQVFMSLTKDFSIPETIYDFEAAYRKALTMEDNSVKLYEDAMAKVSDPGQKKLLEFIIEQEKKHALLMENLVMFVRQPKVWLENAEWNHLDAY